jgi:hypothetical protein
MYKPARNAAKTSKNIFIFADIVLSELLKLEKTYYENKEK